MRTQRMIFGALTMTAITATILVGAPYRAAAAPDGGVPATATPAASGTAGSVAVEPSFSSGVMEVLKLYKGGVPTEIILNYVSSSPLNYYLSADNIIYLQQQGVPKEVLTALLKRQSETQRPMTAASVPVPQTPAPAPVYNYPPENPADNFNNALQARAAESYSYPAAAPAYPAYYPDYYDYYPYYYPYGYGYWPPVYFGLGFGRVGGVIGHGGFGGRVGGGAVGHGGFGGGHGGGGHR